MKLLLIVSIVCFITFLLSNQIINFDLNRNVLKINEIILNILNIEEKENFDIETFKFLILKECNNENIKITNLTCDKIYSKLIINYSHQNINKLTNTNMKIDLDL